MIGYYSTLNKTRILAKWALPDIPNAEVTLADIGMYQYASYADVPIGAHKVTTSYATNTVTWATQPSFTSTAEYTVSSPAMGYNYFRITSLVKDWYSGAQANYGVLFKYPDAQETQERKGFHATEWVNPDGTNYGKPKLVIAFRPKELLGITDYWTYTPDIFQGEGDAAVNVINGNLVYDIPILDLKSRADAFNLKLVYNSRSTHRDAFGHGWTLSAQRKVIPNSDDSIVEYIDENGTRLHFSRLQDDPPGSYTAPEGTYLTLTKSGSEYTIKQTDETMLYFDSYGRNYKVVDEKANTVLYEFDTAPAGTGKITKIKERYGSETAGREVSLVYDANNNLQKITDLKGTETTFTYNFLSLAYRLETINYANNRAEKKTITFSYDSAHNLTSVTDANGKQGSIIYDTSDRVTEIVDPRSTQGQTISAKLSYPSATETVFEDAKGYKTYYKNDFDAGKPTVNVTDITEDYQGTEQSKTHYEWSKNTLTQLIEPSKTTGEATGSAHSATYDNNANLTQANSPNNLEEVNTYDSKNNLTKTTSKTSFVEYTYNSKSDQISSSDNNSQTDHSSYDDYGNETKSTSQTRVTHNRLQNSSFETLVSGLPDKWSRRAIGQYSSSTDKVFGSKSAKTTLASGDGAGYYYQQVPVDADETGKGYTVSAYIKTSNVVGTGANLRIHFLDSGGNYITDGSGNIIVLTTPAITGTNDWTRTSYYFDAPVNTATVQVTLLLTGTGSAYFDGAGLTYGSILDDYYSNENASFEWGSGTSADTWNQNGYLTASDGRSADMKKRGSYSFKLIGEAGVNKYFGQYAEVAGAAGEPVTVSGWAHSTGATPSGGQFGFRIFIQNNDGTSEYFPLDFDKTKSGEWQMVKATFRPAKSDIWRLL